MWNDFFLVLGVPLLDSFRADVMDAVREGYAFAHIPACGFAELTGAPFGKLREIFHKTSIQDEPN
jgi:hypothetical protein